MFDKENLCFNEFILNNCHFYIGRYLQMACHAIDNITAVRLLKKFV